MDYTLSETEVMTVRGCRRLRPVMTDDNTPSTPDSKEVFIVNTVGGGRCRAMRVRGFSSLKFIMDKLDHWPKSGTHANLVDIVGYDAQALEEAHPLLRLVSLCPGFYTIKEYVGLYPECSRRKMCVDVAAGLDYLHARGTFHGAVRPSNVLVKPNGVCVLGEFSDEYHPSTKTLHLYGNFIAPEHLEFRKFYRFGIDRYRDHDWNGEYQQSSDIYGLGCTAIEIYTGTPPEQQPIPYERVKTHKELAALKRSVSTLERQTIPDKTLSIILETLNYIPDARPNSGAVLGWFENPSARRYTPCAPIFAKGSLFRAARDMEKMAIQSWSR